MTYQEMLERYNFHEEAYRPIFESMDDVVPFPPRFEAAVRVGPSSIHGQGLFACSWFHPQQVICPAHLEDDKRTPAGRFTNHSFTPNASPKHYSNGIVLWVAQRPIQPGDEITVDYRAVMRVHA